MASAKQKLIKDWIQYLKNNQIAGMQSNPKNGKLDYKRQPNVTDLTNFLKKDFDEDDILDAIQQVINTDNDQDTTSGAGGELSTQGGRNLSTWHNTEITPGQRHTGISNNPTASPYKKKYDNRDAEDATYSKRDKLPGKSSSLSTWFDKEVSPGKYQDRLGAQMPWKARPKKFNTDNAQDVEVKNKTGISASPKGINGPKVRKPRFKYRYKKGQLKEAIRDWQGKSLSEKEIELVFKILARLKSANPSPSNVQSSPKQSVSSTADQEDQIRKLKRLIRDSLDDQQRQALYRALTDV